jgi:non-ribosomal peptide synthase protein (TIGR01720 family)
MPLAFRGTVSDGLDAALTRRLINDLPGAFRASIVEILLTAVSLAYVRWSGDEALLLDLEGHGREDIFEQVNLSRSVGWFASIYPVLIKVEASDSPGRALACVRDQLRRLPNRGIGYGVLRYLSRNREIVERLSALPRPEICFNYLGQTDLQSQSGSMFRVLRDSSGLSQGLNVNRQYSLSISCFVGAGRFWSNWGYLKSVHRHSSISKLASTFMEVFRELIEEAGSNSSQYSSSDFPAAKISQEELDLFVSEITPIGGA